MNSRAPLTAVAVCLIPAVLALAGCGVLDRRTLAGPGAAAPATTPPAAASGIGDSVRDAGDIPDPCTLLSEEHVTGLTGREVTQIDEDGLAAGTANRYCQWQQSGGQLAVFLCRTTEEDFSVKIADATPVSDVGDRAFALAGHLYVLYGTVSIDVYSRGDSDAENLAEATAVASAIMPQI